MSLSQLILLSGVLHIGTLLASATVPRVLAWQSELASLSKLSRQLIWVHGLFIVLTIIGCGVLTLGYSNELAVDAPLPRAVCGLIALFWGARLLVQMFVFDARPFLTRLWLKLGYHSLTVVFLYQTIALGWVALRPHL